MSILRLHQTAKSEFDSVSVGAREPHAEYQEEDWDEGWDGDDLNEGDDPFEEEDDDGGWNSDWDEDEVDDWDEEDFGNIDDEDEEW